MHITMIWSQEIQVLVASKSVSSVGSTMIYAILNPTSLCCVSLHGRVVHSSNEINNFPEHVQDFRAYICKLAQATATCGIRPQDNGFLSVVQVHIVSMIRPAARDLVFFTGVHKASAFDLSVN